MGKRQELLPIGTRLVLIRRARRLVKYRGGLIQWGKEYTVLRARRLDNGTTAEVQFEDFETHIGGHPVWYPSGYFLVATENDFNPAE